VPLPIYSTQLFLGTLTVVSAWTPFYTVPSGRVLLLRSIRVRNGTGAISSLNLGVTGPITFFSESARPAADEFEWSGWYVLNAGQQLLYFADHAPWNCWASGQLLTIA